MKPQTLTAALFTALLALPQAEASNLEKVYSTGDPIPKPMIMNKFVEFTNARKPPELIFHARDGAPVSMNRHLGNLTLVNIWASWCGPCIKELPALEQMEQAYQDKPLAVVPVSIDEQSPEEVYKILANYRLEGIDTLFDADHSMHGVMPVNVVPATYVLDGSGNIVGFVRGYLDWQDPQVAPYLDKLIAKYSSGQPQG
ncbi:TlpA family protein disulfide reductase [Ferrimonas sediminicola]|uniref:TlpA family protein disulfide reductase n=1 Tax=Ferrimonas sediminicola TaxID=2569538 RepID=A0A4U1BCI5_9GAMM|nr:TlpA disulfide reductase family protein [Ferrimonas sediminicola]TKB48733.1 TlpA family protein disulfide reductase [Ferrimonas sediminicola]